MLEPPDELKRRLLYILHRGLVEARLLAQAGQTQQLHDLADCLESIPAYMSRWREEDVEIIKASLETYRNKYPGNRFNHWEFLDRYVPPEF